MGLDLGQHQRRVSDQRKAFAREVIDRPVKHHRQDKNPPKY
jgi:hypothetical protein